MFDDRRAHIWVVDVKTGATKQVSSGDERNDSEPSWSPNSTRVAFVSARVDATDMRDVDMFVVGADGASAPAKISDLHVGIHAPRWSPDGRLIAYIACENEIAIPKLFISPAGGGKSKLVSNAITYAVELEWTHDGKGLYYTANVKGEHPLFRLDLASSESTPLTEHATVRQIDVDAEHSALAYTASDDTHPGDLYALAEGARAPRQLTHCNAKLLSEVALSPMERVHYKGQDGLDVEGFFMKPVGFQDSRSYPMILMIHGGPNGMWGFQWVMDAQVFAAHGWAVLMTNPRGSSGYGEAFQRGVDKEWGGKAYDDVMAGVDAALAKFPWVDKDRLGVSGHSFGGFMTDWIVGHTNRFKAATTLAGIADFVSVEGTRDGFYGHAAISAATCSTISISTGSTRRLRYAKNVKTPTLVLHGDSDQRVPLEQRRAILPCAPPFRRHLRIRDLPPRGHALRSEPKHAVELTKWQVYWFERFVDGNSNAVRPSGH